MRKGILMLSMLAMTMGFVACSSDDDEKGPYNNDHEYVDLGLPSGIKWATCNIGATTPEGYGGYYAWGETEETWYGWETYFDTKDGGRTFEKYSESGKTVLDLTDDVAHVKWGGNWRMPTKAEIVELLDNCEARLTTQNGVKGYKVASKKNSNSIFFPTARSRYGDGSYTGGYDGCYWSCSLDSIFDDSADYLVFDSGSNWFWSHGSRYVGRSVRAVCP